MPSRGVQSIFPQETGMSSVRSRFQGEIGTRQGHARDHRVSTPGSRAPVLNATLLARVHELNRDYVELLIVAQSHAPSMRNEDALPQKVCEALACVAPAWRAQIAACPFTLYSLRFDDQQFWHTALDDCDVELPADLVCEPVARRYGMGAIRPLASVFCETAAFFAWHTATTSPVAARVLFAMPDALAERLMHTPLWHVRRIAMDYPGLLTPRWPANPGFWPDLVRFATDCDAHRLETARLLGSQLIAAELESAAMPDGKLARLRSRPAKVRR